ncbi:hypothetical protein J2T09_001256 [Neorhizobium huautlense]|uniref:Uncharacterized protein n=1 Tax=Neorhizobium huautlense TaxID=67774 RepID=A0ABT9PPY3_9HYPH|nr:hypothetical protein [Neorhizobium huautlense]MDP9836512.1 hypothetical protein [Neorhizobium huautlense]
MPARAWSQRFMRAVSGNLQHWAGQNGIQFKFELKNMGMYLRGGTEGLNLFLFSRACHEILAADCAGFHAGAINGCVARNGLDVTC